MQQHEEDQTLQNSLQEQLRTLTHAHEHLQGVATEAENKLKKSIEDAQAYEVTTATELSRLISVVEEHASTQNANEEKIRALEDTVAGLQKRMVDASRQTLPVPDVRA